MTNDQLLVRTKWENTIEKLTKMAEDLHTMTQLACGDEGTISLSTDMLRENLSRDITQKWDDGHDSLCLGSVMYKGLYEVGREYKGHIMIYAKCLDLDTRRELIDKSRAAFRIQPQSENEWNATLKQFHLALCRQGKAQ